MTVFVDCKKVKNKKVINTTAVSIKTLAVILTIISFDFITNLSIVNLLDLTIHKLVIFLGFNLILFLFIFDNR